MSKPATRLRCWRGNQVVEVVESPKKVVMREARKAKAQARAKQVQVQGQAVLIPKNPCSLLVA